CARGSEDFVYW
nr:immunoglobulin heavy chain junction region [Macaca mulatta]